MQTPDHVGIICDFCKCVLKNDFKYYSLDFYKIKMYNGRKEAIGHPPSCHMNSFDICSGCYEILSDKVVECYSMNMNSKTGIHKLFCEVSGKNLLDSKLLYYVVFSLIDVKLDNQPLLCSKCSKSSKNTVDVCVCGSNKFARQALVQVKEDVLEIHVSEAVYNEWLIKRENIKAISDWSSSS